MGDELISKIIINKRLGFRCCRFLFMRLTNLAILFFRGNFVKNRGLPQIQFVKLRGDSLTAKVVIIIE